MLSAVYGYGWVVTAQCFRAILHYENMASKESQKEIQPILARSPFLVIAAALFHFHVLAYPVISVG